MEKILVIGGTSFIGRNLVEHISKNLNYEVTLLNRGETNPNLFPELKSIYKNRYTDDLKDTIQQDWDYIIDISCYYPDSLEQICKHILPKLKRYIFISTCSVYDNANCQKPLRNEDSAILECSLEQKNNTDASTYGNRKAECERVLRNSNVSHTILRPALVYGQYDPTDRFYYWLYQSKKCNQLLLPEAGTPLLSTTYVHDLVRAIIKAIDEEEDSTTYNVITTPKTSILKIIEGSLAILDRKAEFVNADYSFLKLHKIEQWMEMPLWIHGDFFTFNNQLIKDQLNFQPTSFYKSIEESIAYFESLDWKPPSFGISEKKKEELLSLLR